MKRLAIIMHDGTELYGHDCTSRAEMEQYLSLIPVGTIKEAPVTDLDKQLGFVPA